MITAEFDPQADTKAATKLLWKILTAPTDPDAETWLDQAEHHRACIYWAGQEAEENGDPGAADLDTLHQALERVLTNASNAHREAMAGTAALRWPPFHPWPDPPPGRPGLEGKVSA